MQSITDFLTSLLNAQTGQLSLLQAVIAVLGAYLGGILSSLTPCVYPMIPITVGVMGGVAEAGAKRAWHTVWLRGLSYVSGMAVVYSTLGVLAGLTGKVFGTMTNTPAWYITLGLVMTGAALAMMDVIPFEPTLWLEQIKLKLGFRRSAPHHHKHPNEMTLFGAFALGASSGFIAAPCTTPVLTSILAFIAKTQSVGLGLSLMLAFSAGLGTLLLVIATFAGALQILPRSGKWMKVVKITSGLILLIFADYLIYRAGTLGGF